MRGAISPACSVEQVVLVWTCRKIGCLLADIFRCKPILEWHGLLEATTAPDHGTISFRDLLELKAAISRRTKHLLKSAYPGECDGWPIWLKFRNRAGDGTF